MTTELKWMRDKSVAASDLRDVPTLARRKHLMLWLLLTIAGLGVLIALSLAVGARSVSLSVVWNSLIHDDASGTEAVIVRDLRLPRTLLGLMVGVALGLAGTVMQGLTRNPLADPGLLGVNAGAALAVVVAIGFFGITSPSSYVWFAFVGAGVAAVVVYVIGAMGRNGATPVKLALAGAALTALLASAITVIQLRNIAAFNQFRFWQIGSLAGRDIGIVRQVLPFVVVGAVLALLSGRMLNTLALGDDVARALGQHIGLTRALAAVAIVLLCGAATAAAGPIAFVGLAIPHAARLITGPDFRWMLAYSAALAPSLLLTADILGRVVAGPGELQVGIVTALIGAPVLIILVRRRRVARL